MLFEVPIIAELIAKLKACRVLYDNCAWGATYRKCSELRANCPPLCSLGRACADVTSEHTHEHLEGQCEFRVQVVGSELYGKPPWPRNAHPSCVQSGRDASPKWHHHRHRHHLGLLHYHLSGYHGCQKLQVFLPPRSPRSASQHCLCTSRVVWTLTSHNRTDPLCHVFIIPTSHLSAFAYQVCHRTYHMSTQVGRTLPAAGASTYAGAWLEAELRGHAPEQPPPCAGAHR